MLLTAVVVLLVLLLQERGAPRADTLLAQQGQSVAQAPSAVASPNDAGTSPYVGWSTLAPPGVNGLDPKAPAASAPGVAPPGATTPTAPDPLGGLVQGFGQGLGVLLDDPSLKKALKDLDKNIQKGRQIFGQLLGKQPGRAPAAPSTPSPPGGRVGGALADLLNSLVQGLGGGAADTDPDEPARIEASVREHGGRYEVVCRFPRGGPETARFEVAGDKLIVKATFKGAGEVVHEVELPGPAHPVGARSELRGGELVITLSKAQ